MEQLFVDTEKLIRDSELITKDSSRGTGLVEIEGVIALLDLLKKNIWNSFGISKERQEYDNTTKYSNKNDQQVS